MAKNKKHHCEEQLEEELNKVQENCDNNCQCDEKKQENTKEAKLLKEVKDLTEINNNLKAKVFSLELELKKKDQEFIAQLEQKTKQVQEILNNKTNELENKFEQKVSDALFKVFSQKTSTLLETINHFNKIVDKDYDDPKIQAFIFGFKMFSQNMIDGLKDLKITKIIPQIGTLINESEVEVFEVIEDSDQPSMTILEVVNEGFKFEDKVIKFASVKVAK